MDPTTFRQQVLFLWLDHSGLDGRVVGWAFHDGADLANQCNEQPYARGVDALADGWRLFQVSQLSAQPAGQELQGSFLQHEFVF